MNRVQRALARQRERTRGVLKNAFQQEDYSPSLDDLTALLEVMPAILQLIEVVDAIEMNPGGALERARLGLNQQVAHHLDAP